MSSRKSERKQRVVVWLYPDQIKKMERLMRAHEMANHTEFVALAVDFYIGYLHSSDSTGYLSEHLLSALNGALANTEKRMAGNLFRMSVEMSMMMNILAAGLDMTDNQLEKMRGRCVEEVKASKGRVAFEDALAYQRGDG